MYEVFFDFEQRPFASAPDVDMYFPSTAIDTARQTLIRCIQRCEGAAMVVGPSGTGKTLLCQMLARHFKQTHDVVMLCRGRLSTRKALYQAILYELGRPYRHMDEGELRLSLIDYLTKGAEAGSRSMVLLVDEAHTLPLRLFEEIRLMSNLVRDGNPRVHLVMVGGPLLEERFASPKLDSFSQRLVARCYLESFDAEETTNYLAAQLQLARGQEIQYVDRRMEEESEDELVSEENQALEEQELEEEEKIEVPVGGLFLQEACRAVYHATDGIPRLVNQLCDHALLLAYVLGKRTLDATLIEEAWADLQQLPTPWNGDAENEEERNIIEFGGLENEPEVSDIIAEEEAIPALNLKTMDEELTEFEQQMEQRLEQIEQTLQDAEDEEEDFQPVGSIGPEVELRFAEPVNPFGEPFEEEEVVVDRYAPSVVATPPSLPSPPTWEEAPAEQPVVETENEPAWSMCDAGTGAPCDESVSSEVVDAPAPQEMPTLVTEAGPQEAVAETPAGPETVPMRRPHTIEMVEPGDTNLRDADLIVVEEGYDDSETHTPRPRVARRGEYRQLFAKLRRG